MSEELSSLHCRTKRHSLDAKSLKNLVFIAPILIIILTFALKSMARSIESNVGERNETVDICEYGLSSGDGPIYVDPYEHGGWATDKFKR